jgi:hypothetical protein
VWQSATVPASGAQSLSVSQDPFYANGSSTLTISSGTAAFIWNGTYKDGNVVGTGDYFMKAQIVSGSTTSVTSKVITVIVQKPVNLAAVTLGPNPASSVLVFDLSQAPPGIMVDIQVWNLAGELIHEFQASGGPQSKLVWNLSAANGQSLADGVYIALFRTAGGDPTLQDKRSIKFVVMRQ